MDRERWQQVDTIFKSALEREPVERARFLDEACAGDAALREEVESLIAHDETASFMETPASDDAARLLAADETDALVGQTIGSYQILEKIGAGGMGEVYLALHAKTKRKVALKLLPAHFAGDEQRVRRFQQEAHAVLALNHPNIVTVYDIEQAGDTHLIASELIEGETLRRRMARAAFNLPEALDVAIQAAAALAAAHGAGVVHRDIKPENVMLRPDGYVKVLDFGLAKLTERQTAKQGGDSEAATRALVNTTPGMVMGTVAYMSPEQARGLEVDARTDVWSLGVVLYEMLARQLPFAGETAGDVMAAILQKEPPPLARFWSQAPDAIEWIVTKTLTKEQDERYQTAKELLTDLKRLKRRLEYEAEAERSVAPTISVPLTSTSGEAVAQSTAEKTAASTAETATTAHTTSSAEYITAEIKRHKSGALVALAVFALALAGGGYGLYRLLNRSSPAAPFQTMKIDRLSDTGGAVDAAVSPDGEFVAYIKEEAGRQSLWLRQTSAASSVRIVPPAEGVNFGAPSFSPDGAFIYYLKAEKESTRATLYRTPKLGGDERKLIEDISLQVSKDNFSLSPDGKQVAFIRLDPDPSLFLTDTDGSNERKLISRAAPEFLTAAAWSPDGQTVVCIAGTFGGRGGSGARKVIGVRIADGTEREIAPEGWTTINGLDWLADSSGLVVSASEKNEIPQLWHLSYPDGATRRITNDLSDYASVSLTANSSTLAAVQVNRLVNIWSAALDASADNAKQLTHGLGRRDGDKDLSLTPDGKIIYHSLASGNWDIWSVNADGSGNKQLTTAGANAFPSACADGRYIVFSSDRSEQNAIWRMDIDGGNPKQLTESGVNPSCSPDGQWVFYYAGRAGRAEVWKAPIDGGESVEVPMPAKDTATAPVVSPDGRFIACNYLVGEPGAQFRIGVLPIAGGEPIKIFEVNSYAIKPLGWTPDSRAVTYIDTRAGVSNIWRLPLDGSAPAPVTNFNSGLIWSFASSRDGQRLALSRGAVNSDVVLLNDSK